MQRSAESSATRNLYPLEADRVGYSLYKTMTQRMISDRSVMSAHARGVDLTMLYLLLPNGTMKSAMVTDDVLRNIAAGVDVSQFDWSDHDQRSDSIITGLAVRYGMKNARGIVLSGTYVRLARRPGELVAGRASASAITAASYQLDRLVRDRDPSRELIKHWIGLGGRVQRARDPGWEGSPGSQDDAASSVNRMMRGTPEERRERERIDEDQRG